MKEQEYYKKLVRLRTKELENREKQIELLNEQLALSKEKYGLGPLPPSR